MNETLRKIYHDVDIKIQGREAQPYFKTNCKNIQIPQAKRGSIYFKDVLVQMDIKRFLLSDKEDNQCMVKLQILWIDDLPTDKLKADAIISLHM